MSQEIQDIKIEDLTLWSENPRDPINANTTDQEFADRAINKDQRGKWSLKKLCEEMGPRYDQSEIPTVVYENSKPVVYDGNRRVLIGKIIHRCVAVSDDSSFATLYFPKELPCNVCDRRTALEHVDRKHGESGSWDPLERDIFRQREMNKGPSPFLVLEKTTDIISSYPELNKRFVRDEIFDTTNLHKMGFSVNENQLKSRYTKNDGDAVLSEVLRLVENKTITTRKNRGEIIPLLKGNPTIKKIISSNLGSRFELFSTNTFRKSDTQQNERKTPITKGKEHELFGEKLQLQSGTVNNIYSDLLKLHKLYKAKNKSGYSDDFPRIIRMGLRLICELAADKNGQKLGKFLQTYFDRAKTKLNKDEKTTLSSQKIENAKDCIKLLQQGAHGYTAAKSIEQTVALSLLIGKILEITHAKNSK